MDFYLKGTTYGREKFSVWYQSGLARDQGIQLEHLKERSPIAIYDQNERVATALGNFRFSHRNIASSNIVYSTIRGFLNHEYPQLFLLPPQTPSSHTIMSDDTYGGTRIYLGQTGTGLSINVNNIHSVHAATLDDVMAYLSETHPQLPLPLIREHPARSFST